MGLAEASLPAEGGQVSGVVLSVFITCIYLSYKELRTATLPVCHKPAI